MRRFRTYSEVETEPGSRIVEQVQRQRARLEARLSRVGALIAIVSGKGGVGKSAITANLAVALACRGARVGALDADLHGPSLGRMLNVSGEALGDGPDGIEPAIGLQDVKVISAELLLGEEDTPFRWGMSSPDSFVWQSAAETGVLRELLSDVVWGDLDYLLVDVAPGTDKIGRLLALVPAPDQVILVTTPSEIARFVVAKSARLLREAGIGAVGVVGNMTEYVEPNGSGSARFEGDGVAALAEEAGLPVWGQIPFDPRIALSTDRGRSAVVELAGTPGADAFEALARRVETEPGGARFVP